jgi:hypothetical protein
LKNIWYRTGYHDTTEQYLFILKDDDHPNPDEEYSGTFRTAYLPDNIEGNSRLIQYS